MPRKPKKTTGAKRRGRAPVARGKKKAGPVLVPARKSRGAALAEALAPIFERLEHCEESIKELWLMRQQINAISKEVGDAKYAQAEALPQAAELLERVEAAQAQTRRMVEALAVNTFDKIQEIKDAK